jgi:hypothetical protein
VAHLFDPNQKSCGMTIITGRALLFILRTVLIFLAGFIFLVQNARAQGWQWKNSWQSPAFTDDAVYQHRFISHAPNGNVFIALDHYYESEDSSKSSISSFSPAGDHLWTREYPFRINAFKVSPDGEIFTGSQFSGTLFMESILPVSSSGNADILLAHLDSQGEMLNYRVLSTSDNENVAGICFSGSDVIVSGTYTSTMVIGSDSLASNGSFNAFLLRMDANFNVIGKYITDCEDCSGGQIESSSDGSLVWMTGYSGHFYFSDSMLWESGGRALLKISEDFIPVSQKQIAGGGSVEQIFKLDANDNVILQNTQHFSSGGFSTNIEAFDENMNSRWIINPAVNSKVDFDIDPGNNLYWCGWVGDEENTFVDAMVSKVNSSGNTVWVRNDTSNGAALSGISVFSEDNFIVSGSNRVNSVIGPFSIPEAGDLVAFYGSGPVSANEQADPKPIFSVFPNPANGNVSVVHRSGGILKVFDSRGMLCRQETFQPGTNILDCGNLPSGCYFLQLLSDSGIFARRLIIR